MWISLAFERIKDGSVDQLDDGRDVVAFGGELVDGERFVGVVFFTDHIEREAFGDLLEDALALFGFLEKVGDLGERGYANAKFLVQ
jgi:hypothetical protein